LPRRESVDTGGEVTIVAESDGTTDPDEPTGPERFRKLPERIRLGSVALSHRE
jgi:hypothetical protein